MKSILVSCLALIATVMISQVTQDGTANAGSCGATATCDISLTNTNVIGLAVTVKVTIDNSATNGNGGTSTVLRVEYQSSNITNTPLGIDDFAFNVPTTIPPVTLLSVDGTACTTKSGKTTCGDWKVGSGNADGFGNFSITNSDPAGTQGLLGDPILFTLNSIVTTFPENDRGSEFAAHVRFDSTSTCSGWVSDGTSNATTDISTTGCVPDQPFNPTPEPGTLLLVGSLLSGLGIFGRKKFLKIVKD